MVATYNVIYVCFVCNFECIIMIISSLYNISSLAVYTFVEKGTSLTMEYNNTTVHTIGCVMYYYTLCNNANTPAP